jgi:4-coumarate--CoA ligase (photoactive yellow protein activation family)
MAANIMQESQALIAIIKQCQEKCGVACSRLVTTVPLHHLYGFMWSIVVPLQINIPVVYLHGAMPATVVRELQEGDILISIPFLWQELIHQRQAFPKKIVGVSSTAPLSEHLSRNIVQSIECLYDVYGATETGAIGIRFVHHKSQEEPYKLLPYWQIEGDELRRNKQCSDVSIESSSEADTVFPLPDVLTQLSHSTFFPVRRRDGGVQVGGCNVFPSQIEATILLHEDIQECAVRSMHIGTEVQLKLFVVCHQDKASSLQEHLPQWIAENLHPLERPKHITYGRSLPLNTLGKQTDW